MIQGDKVYAAYTTDVSRQGVGFLSPRQLMPKEKWTLKLPNGAEYELLVTRCHLESENCFACGGRFDDSKSNNAELLDHRGNSNMTRVEEIMNRRVVTVDAGDDARRRRCELFTENHVGGAPVVDGRGRVVGMISELQLLDVVFDLEAREHAGFRLHDAERPMRACRTIRSPTSPRCSPLYSFRRLPVIENGRLVGIVTRRDLMNYALATGAAS